MNLSSFLSPLDSFAALAIFRKLAGESIVVHRRTRTRLGLSWKLTYVNGFLHSVNDEPAVEFPIMSMYGLGIRTVWYRNGLPHQRDPDPAVVQTGAEGRVIEQSWLINGKFRNDHRPSTIWNIPSIG